MLWTHEFLKVQPVTIRCVTVIPLGTPSGPSLTVQIHAGWLLSPNGHSRAFWREMFQAYLGLLPP